jgi:NADH-quinone oxidoreductase subunit N
MESGLMEKIDDIQKSLLLFSSEAWLCGGIILIIFFGLIFRRTIENPLTQSGFITATLLLLCISLYSTLTQISYTGIIFSGMLRLDKFSACLKILFDIGGMLTLLMTFQRNSIKHISEYNSLVLAIVTGAHLLVMSNNLLMVFLSVEILSISSYLLAGFSFSKQAAEGSLKYFLFGSVASATMLYGFSLLYGFTGTLNFSSAEFANGLAQHNTPLFFIAGLLCFGGILYKIAAFPMHPWAPDVYEAAPMPVIALFSVVPKLAGIGILTRFVVAINTANQSNYDWQLILCGIAILTLTVGNFSALWQKKPKRLMAYSSIAQSGFLLVGIAAWLPEGIDFMLFYAAVYLIMNFLVFFCLQYFESQNIVTIDDFSGKGKYFIGPSIGLLTGLISLTGLPPTGGFMAKVFIFSSLWKSYEGSGKSILMWLFVIGLLNTVVSLFYYLRIPYYAFLKSGANLPSVNSFSAKNLFSLILVLLLLILFFQPNLLMSWINRINFVL